MSAYATVRTVEEFTQQPGEYQTAVKKIVRSHALNELYGAQVFDEPAIKLAPTPYAKWLTCRVAMEEYHHHVRFKELADQIGVRPEEMDTRNKRPLNIFEVPLESWEQFCVIKMLGDLAEILQVEDLLHCSFVPLRNIARATMPEEKFHAQFGLDFCVDLVETAEGRAKVQRAVDGFYPEAPKFFGASGSKNNAAYRKYGLKLRSNEDMRADYMARAGSTVEPLGITLPEVKIFQR
jgi:ring-1,2-phenylacetyl-CoA epoxidase subunit PaaA